MKTKLLFNAVRAGLLAAAFLAGQQARAANILVLGADSGGDPSSQLMGLDGITSSTYYDTTVGTPSLASIQGYSAILAYTNYVPFDGTALGDVLKQYVDGGGQVVLATYALSPSWAISGGIMTPGYSPLIDNSIDAQPSGSLVATVPGNPIFNGVDLSSLTYFSNGNFAVPGLDSGATLLATDGIGTYMIAVNAAGNVYADNLFPEDYAGNNGQFYQLLANELTSSQTVTVPDGSSTALLLSLGAMATAFAARKFKKRA